MQSLEKIEYKKKLENNVHFQEGRRLFLEKKLPPQESVKYKWCKKTVSKAEFNKNYQHSSYPILITTQEEVQFAYMNTGKTNDLEITSIEELRTIDNYLRARNLRPFVFEDVEVKKEVNVSEIEF